MKVIGKNIDTLELGYYGNVFDKMLDKLEIKKNWRTNKADEEEYQEINHDNIIKIGELDFVVYPHGVSKYKYMITNNLFTITINERGQGDPYPNVRVKVSSYCLWNEEEWYINLRKILAEILEIEREIVSRVDIAVDFSGYEIKIEEMNDVVTRSRKSNAWWEGRELESLYFGSSSAKIMARIYNKTKEILASSNKVWFLELWEELGYKEVVENSDVWRVEFQLRRKALVEFGVGGYESLLGVLGDIYYYLTHEWIRFVNMDDSNITRATVKEWWVIIQGVDIGNRSYIKRERTKKVNLKALKASAIGFIASLHAWYERHSENYNILNDLEYTLGVIRREIEEMGSEYALKIRQRKVMYQAL